MVLSSRPTTPSATRSQAGPREGGREKLGGTKARRRSDAARHHRLLLLSDQGAGGEPGRHHLPAGWRRWSTALKQAVQFGLDKQLPPRRRAAGARSAARPAAGSAHRHLGVRVVLEAAERSACRPSSSPTSASEAAAMCRRRAPGSASPRSMDLRARRQPGEVARSGQDGQGAAGLQAAAGGGADAGRRLLPRGRRISSSRTSSSATRSRRASDPEDCSRSTEVVKGVDAAGTLDETGCKMTWPA